MRALAAFAIACALGAACKGGSGAEEERRPGSGSPAEPHTGSGSAGELPGEAESGGAAATKDAAAARASLGHAIEPDWQVRIPGESGMPVLQASVGPVLAGPLVVVGSSAIGFAALDRRTGEVIWQRRGEERPGRPAVVGFEIWLPGSCDHVREGRPDGPVLGCAERVRARDGELIGRFWVRVPQSVGPDVRARALAATRDRGLLWAGGNALWLAGAERPTSKLADLGSPALAAAEDADWLWAMTERSLTARPRQEDSRAGADPAAGWKAEFPEPVVVGVAGPARVGPVVAWVRDGALEARQVEGGKGGFAADGRHAYAPGSLRAVGGALFAVALDGGISPVRVDPATGRRLWRGDRVAGIQVLAAGFAPAKRAEREAEAPLLAVAIRPAVSLKNDAVALFDERGALRGVWALPEPQRPRTDPPGVAAESGVAYLFFDGRIAARLSVRSD